MVTPGRTLTVSYRETWTRPDNCVYALVLPPDCVASQLSINCPGYRFQPSVSLAATADERIFYYLILMGERGTLSVSARIQLDQDQQQRVLLDSKLVAATSRYADIGKSLKRGALSNGLLVQTPHTRRKVLGDSLTGRGSGILTARAGGLAVAEELIRAIYGYRTLPVLASYRFLLSPSCPFGGRPSHVHARGWWVHGESEPIEADYLLPTDMHPIRSPHHGAKLVPIH